MTAATAAPANSEIRNSRSDIIWSRKHLLGLEDLSREEITAVLDTAESFLEISKRSRKKTPALRTPVR